jgi:hypothetical protein
MRLSKPCNQIDRVLTLLGLINWSYTTRNFAMLKTKQESTLGKVDLKAGNITLDPIDTLKPQLEDTMSLYQSASWLFRNGHLGAETDKP